MENKDYVRELRNNCDAYLGYLERAGGESDISDGLLEAVFTSIARLKDFNEKSANEIVDDEVKVVRSMDELRDYLEENGWHIYDDDGYWDVSQHSPAGEDFLFCIVHNNDVEEAIKEIKRYADDFDIDEHVKMWVGAQGRVSGVPDTVTLVEDAQDIQKMLDNLADGVNFCEQKTIGEIVAEAQAKSEEVNLEPGLDTDKDELDI